MMKSTSSQQVKSGQTKEVSWRVASNVTPHTLDSAVSFEFSSVVTRDEDHVANEDTKNVENQGWQMGQVQDSIATERTRRNPRKPAWLTADIIIAYALSIIGESIPSTHREGEISSESEM